MFYILHMQLTAWMMTLSNLARWIPTEGVWWESSEGEELACLIDKSSNVTFAGVYVHCGNSYRASQPRDIEQVREDTIGELRTTTKIVWEA